MGDIVGCFSGDGVVDNMEAEVTDRNRNTEIYLNGQERVATTPAPEGQKFPCGSRVRIADDLGPMMAHFTSGADATILYTYAHAYGGSDERSVKIYALDIDGHGHSSWYEEHQLTAIEEVWPEIIE